PSGESFANFHRSVAGRIAKSILGKLREKQALSSRKLKANTSTVTVTVSTSSTSSTGVGAGASVSTSTGTASGGGINPTTMPATLSRAGVGVGVRNWVDAGIKTGAGVSLNGLPLTALWKQRLWSRTVKYGRDLTNTVRYIFQNPVKSGVLDLLQTDRILFDEKGVLKKMPLLL
ncbi:MAG: hypothetical protein AB1540_13385, partial [Bdellovibrionota bacterium]